MKQPVLTQVERPTWKQRLKVIRLFINIYHINRKRQPILRSTQIAFHCCSLIWKDGHDHSAK
ncbi:hypothetical protein [Sporolactobacillus laevolacticus]|uniref:Uncharacterized protein n=1 Tax=Sporolactobacillus laevolacticus DSM 442 TaxID=1395513 RepID=V6J678_9BACL|nr:hypothetical protein [Sporolactobacillus laevolacticus]EST12274.1 hypothetical protein P343_08890 [Sporolactobacillus laevolacticus DSM 442]MDN3953904.1 hypothetical protein [Sporolactobacillus laevolacticus]